MVDRDTYGYLQEKLAEMNGVKYHPSELMFDFTWMNVGVDYFDEIVEDV